MTTLATPPLPLIETPEDPLVREYFEALASGRGILNLHRMMAHAPALMKASGEMAMTLRRDTMLPRALAELAVLRTAQLMESDYVWARHLPLARACGVSERQIEEIANWPHSAAFTLAQKAALGFAEKAARQSPVKDGDWVALKRYFSSREIVEIAMLIGFYVSTAIFIKALAIPPEKA